MPCDLEVSIAKGWSSDAHETACWRAHQVLAGVGYTVNDGVLPLYSKRGKTLQIYLGDTAYHKEKIAQQLEKWSPREIPKGKPLGLWEEREVRWVPEWWDDFEKSFQK